MEGLAVGQGVVIPDGELRITFTRSGGPGGQNVNKRATRAEIVFALLDSPSVPADLKRRAQRRLRHRLDALGRVRVVADDERTQRANRELARARLATLLATAFEPPAPPRKRTRPSTAARERRIAEKKRRGQVKRARRVPHPDD